MDFLRAPFPKQPKVKVVLVSGLGISASQSPPGGPALMKRSGISIVGHYAFKMKIDYAKK